MTQYTEKLTLRELVNVIMDTGCITKVTDAVYEMYYEDQDPPTPKPIVGMMYTDTIAEILNIEPDDEFIDKYEIYITLEKTEDDSYINVGLLDKKENKPYSIDLQSWSKLVDLKITTTITVDIYCLLAHILWEITFYGMTDEDVMREAKDLEKLAEDADNLIEVEWDKIKQELKPTKE